MNEIAIIIGALAAFCLLTFGAAWLIALWMSAPSGSVRRSQRRARRSRRR